jgi:HD-GYP domain-containing protein (c-di-GMP phosphodiesterase class II)
LAHHERIDGTGYPRGLSDGDIPIQSRIIAIADAYDAMTSERTYRDMFSEEEAVAELHRCAGTHSTSGWPRCSSRKSSTAPGRTT